MDGKHHLYHLKWECFAIALKQVSPQQNKAGHTALHYLWNISICIVFVDDGSNRLIAVICSLWDGKKKQL